MRHVINELNATIAALPYDADSGKLGEPVATVPTVPDDFPEAKSTAEILVHPSGDFLYGTNRRFSDHPAADSIAVFRLDEQGVPKRVQLVTENIAFPRAIQLDPAGTWLYALNQKGDSMRDLGQTMPVLPRAIGQRHESRGHIALWWASSGLLIYFNGTDVIPAR
jgi:6-phosphogluconolactonase